MNNIVCTAVHNTIGKSSSLIKNYPSSCDVHVNLLFLLPLINYCNIYIILHVLMCVLELMASYLKGAMLMIMYYMYMCTLYPLHVC